MIDPFHIPPDASTAGVELLSLSLHSLARRRTSRQFFARSHKKERFVLEKETSAGGEIQNTRRSFQMLTDFTFCLLKSRAGRQRFVARERISFPASDASELALNGNFVLEIWCEAANSAKRRRAFRVGTMGET
jgi:hypothetical protein